MSRSKISLRVLALLALLSGLGCSNDAQVTEHSHSVRATALVRNIDRAARRVEIQVNFARYWLKVSDEVTVLDEIEVGDRFPLRYRYASTARVLPRGSELAPLQSKLKLSGPIEGRPGNALVQEQRIIAEFVDFDHRSKETTFRRADGSYRVFLATGPFQGFVAGLGYGDRVELVIEEAIAILLEPIE